MHFIGLIISFFLITGTPATGSSPGETQPVKLEVMNEASPLTQPVELGVNGAVQQHNPDNRAFSDSTDPDRTLAVSTRGKVILPADRIQFNINLNGEADSPQQAYELHKEREEVLVDLLKKFDIPEEDIRYEPISISRANRPRQEQEPTYRTSQQVRLMIEDFSHYEQIQVRLIESGYDSFSGSFMSSKAEEGKDQAIRNALKKAKEKARVMAGEAGVELGEIKVINYHETPETPQYARASMAMDSESSLMEFEQTVTISASVSINYQITGGN